jgi:REP element-mobilizing transposase RayT
VLLPRIKTQSLSGDLGSFLRAELPNLFLAYGWRLDALQIDPAYLQWQVRIPPSIAPTAHIKTVRTQTSKLILSNFHRLNRNELLHDFWAPGYLLGSGKELIPLEEVNEFIRLNRSQHYSEIHAPRPSR